MLSFEKLSAKNMTYAIAVNSDPRCSSLGFHLALPPTAACSAGMNCEARDSVPGCGWDKTKAYS